MPGILVSALFAAALPNAVVLQPVANMYSKPALDAEVVSQAIYGSNVAMLEQQNDWAHVRTFDDYTGWMPLSWLKAGAAYAAGPAAEVRSLFAHIYRDATTTHYAPLITVPMETRLELSGGSPGAGEGGSQWIAVRLPDLRTGYVQRGDVSFDPPKLSIPEMAEFAKRFLGLPYTWGGTSTYGYDCSGFMQMLERHRGVNMPRDAQPQAHWEGQTVVRSKEDLEPGDLLYFGARGGPHHAYGHVPRRRQIYQRDHLPDSHGADRPHRRSALRAAIGSDAEAQMNRRDFFKGAAAGMAASSTAAAAGAANPGNENRAAEPLHTWTTTMSASQYRDTLYVAYSRDGITGHGEGAPIVRYKEDAASRAKGRRIRARSAACAPTRCSLRRRWPRFSNAFPASGRAKPPSISR